MTTHKQDKLLRKGDYIWGSFIKPAHTDGYIVGLNPGDRSDILGRFSFSEASVDDAMDAAIAGSAGWRHASQANREEVIKRLRDNLNKTSEELAHLVTRETGKPTWEARQEVISAVRSIELLLEDGLKALSTNTVADKSARCDLQPRGVIGIITPFSNPVLIPVTQIAAAILAGNAVVFKPSKYVPGVGQAIATLIDRSKLPRGVFNMVQGSGATIGRKVASHRGLNALLFSGSYQSAQKVQRALMGRPEVPLFMQAGGKGSAIVLADANIDQAVYEIVLSATLTTGQRHNSTARVFVVDSLFDEFSERLTQIASEVKVGYGFDNGVLMGPLISDSARTSYRKVGALLTKAGHTPLLETSTIEVPGRRGFFVGPAIYWVHWENGEGFLSHQPTGPVIALYRVSCADEAVSLHNKQRARLVTSIFSKQDDDELAKVMGAIRTGGININRGTIGASIRLPSVGLGISSNGFSSGLNLIKLLTVSRSTLIERRPFDDSVKVPGMPSIHSND